MRTTVLSFLSVVMTCLGPTATFAALGDCGQPFTSGAIPTATDSLFILQASVGSANCSRRCVCDLNNDGKVVATDALQSLTSAVAQQAPSGCECPTPECASGLLSTSAGSRLELGWNGFGHAQEFVEGASFGFRIVRRCATAPATTCATDDDCPDSECRPTCSCDDPEASVCEIEGPTGPGHCFRSGADCSGDVDCGISDRCERLFGPSLPLFGSAPPPRDVPFCALPYFSGDVTGTLDVATGESSLVVPLRMEVVLGLAADQPCPRCGAPNDQPNVGDLFQCEGGASNGAVCSVDAVSRTFGGVSSSCRPDISGELTPGFLTSGSMALTTGTAARSAGISCVVPGICTDDGAECSSNADCRRCDNDLSACGSNADCEVGASCAEAPDQPISCGFYCHCAFCAAPPGSVAEPQSCSQNADCEMGVTCEIAESGAEQEPNSCADRVCGRSPGEQCCADGDLQCPAATPLSGRCSEKPFEFCDATSPCSSTAGECVLARQPCFENTIARNGVPSPLGKRCLEQLDRPLCSNNADCNVGNCVGDTAAPTFVAVFCSPQTPSGAINASIGLPAPATMNLKTTLRLCRCGDGVLGCVEECDDGNLESGDGCSRACRAEGL